MKEIIIVGAGIGGLCTAVRLLNKGYKVTILEKESRIGGKVNIKYEDRFKFDLTASILMTPHIYTDIFKEVSKDYNEYIELINLDTIYRVNYHDGTRYDFSNDSTKMLNILEDIKYGLSSEYLNFLSKSLEKYLISKKCFLDKNMINIKEVINLETIRNLIKIMPLSSSNKYIESTISNQKLRDYFIFQTMYIGINPYKYTNLYTLIPAISHSYGLCYIKGGVYKYILALEKLICEFGGKIEVENNVEEIILDKGKVSGVKSNKGIYKSDIVICNADYPYAIENLFKHNIDEFIYKCKNIDKKEYSCSVFIIYLGLNKKYEDLEVHNIYINKNFREGIESAFKGKFTVNPSLYLYSPSAIDESVCSDGGSTLNITLRVPNLSYRKIKWSKETISKLRNNIMNEVKKIKGLEDIDKHIEYENYLTPKDLSEKFNTYNGNAFGLSHKLNQSACFRPHIKSRKIKGLYFIGSSTHPGNGVSVIIEGSKVLASLIYNEYKDKN